MIEHVEAQVWEVMTPINYCLSPEQNDQLDATKIPASRQLALSGGTNVCTIKSHQGRLKPSSPWNENQ
jgi:hypothetical protein